MVEPLGHPGFVSKEGSSSEKRERDDPVSDTPAVNKKPRSATSVTPGQWDHNWEVGMDVIVNVHGSGWVDGEVYSIQEDVIIDGNEYIYAVAVRVPDNDNRWTFPCTWHDQPHPIPNNKTRDYIHRKKDLSELQSQEQLRYLVLKATRDGCCSFVDEGNLSEIDRNMLDDTGEISLKETILGLMNSQEAQDVIAKVTGSAERENMSVANVLAFLLGRMAGCELQSLCSDDASEKSDQANWILDGLTNTSTTRSEQLDDLDCQTVKIFLTSVMVSRTTKRKKYNLKNGLFDGKQRRLGVLDNQDKFEKRAGKLLTAIQFMHAAQSSKTQYSGPASAALFHGLNLLLDMKGVSDKLVQDLSGYGITSSAKTLRRYMSKAAAAIDFKCAREPHPDGLLPVVANTADNADFHLYGRVFSAVPMATLLLCFESPKETRYLNENYLRGLPLPSEDVAKQMLPNAEDDKVAQETILYQNAHALIVALCEAENPALDPLNSTKVQQDGWKEGDTVDFRFRHAIWHGTVGRVEKESC